MSEAISALNGKTARGDVTVTDAGLRGMITLRGDLASNKLKAVCTTLTGLKLPAPGKAVCDGGKGIFWMSPDEVLLLVPYDQVAAGLDAINKALKGKHYLAENVSDARALIVISGPYARDVMAKLAPIDLHPDTFQPGDFRRTRLGQVAAAFWLRDADTFEVICFRSVAEYAFGLLSQSAKAGPVRNF